MSELKTNINNTELMDIKSLEIINIMKTIKIIQTRMKDPDMMQLSYIRVYDALGKEFSHFSDKYTKIFTMVIRGENLNTITTVLYYRDKVIRGLMTEEQLMELLKKKFLTEEQQKAADIAINKMREDGQI